MHLRTLLIIAPGLLALSLSGCIKDRSEGATLPIEGLWVNTSLQNDLVIYEKQNSFDEALPGFEFFSDGQMIKRQDASCCSWPPLTLEEVSGIWTQEAEARVRVSYPGINGTVEETWSVVLLNGNELQMELLETRHTL